MSLMFRYPGGCRYGTLGPPLLSARTISIHGIGLGIVYILPP